MMNILHIEDSNLIEEMVNSDKSLKEIYDYFELNRKEKELDFFEIKEEYLKVKTRKLVDNNSIEELCEMREMLNDLEFAIRSHDREIEENTKFNKMRLITKYNRVRKSFQKEENDTYQYCALNCIDNFKDMYRWYQKEIDFIFENSNLLDEGDYLKEEIDFFIETYTEMQNNTHEYFLENDKEYRKKYFEQQKYNEYNRQTVGKITVKENSLLTKRLKDKGDEDSLQKINNVADGEWTIETLIGEKRIINDKAIKHTETENALLLVHSDFKDKITSSEISEEIKLEKNYYGLSGLNISSEETKVKTSELSDQDNISVENNIIRLKLKDNYNLSYDNETVKVLRKDDLIIGLIIDLNKYTYYRERDCGPLDLSNGEVYVGEAGYDANGVILENLKKGIWNTSIKETVSRRNFYRSGELVIKFNENIDDRDINIPGEFIYTGGAALGFYTTEILKNKDYFKEYFKDCDISEDEDLFALKYMDSSYSRYNFGKIDNDKGVFSSTGFGDGDYCFYTHKDKNGKIDAIRFIFI